jgi:hypothetical protein
MSDTTIHFARRAYQQNKAAQNAFIASLGVDVFGMAYARKISLFCDTARAPVAELFVQLQAAATPTLCLLPQGLLSAADAVAATRGGLTVHVLPELDAAAYERLLWTCDFNFVHGDDDAAPARARAAGRPFIWQAADADAAAARAVAVVERYSAALPPHAAATLRAATLAWNRAQAGQGAAPGATDRAAFSAISACLAGPVHRTLTLHAAALALDAHPAEAAPQNS